MKNENESVENILFVSCLLLLLPPLLSFRDDVLYFYLETGCNKSPVTSVGNSFPLHTCFPHSLSPFECLMCFQFWFPPAEEERFLATHFVSSVKSDVDDEDLHEEECLLM